jgi:hypothetical protein
LLVEDACGSDSPDASNIGMIDPALAPTAVVYIVAVEWNTEYLVGRIMDLDLFFNQETCDQMVFPGY